MKLNESNLADPLLLNGCAITIGGQSAWGSGASTGPFGSQDLISTTTFPDDALILPPTPASSNSGLSAKSSPHNNSGSGVELDALLIVQSTEGYAELKPLPPFEFAANPSVQITLSNDPHLPQMPQNNSNNNNSSSHNNSQTSSSSSNNNNAPNNLRNGGSGGSTGGSSIVSSPNAPSFSSSSVVGSPNSGLFDAVSSSTSVPISAANIPPNIKSELADYLMNSDIDDIAALIGNAIADSTVPNLGIELDPNGVTSSTIDPWTELDAWIESACQQTTHHGQVISSNGPGGNGPRILMDQDSTIHTSAADHSFLENSSTLQTLLEADSLSAAGNNGFFHHPGELKQEFHHSTSILQSRLQQPIPSQLLRVPGPNGPNSSPSQLPESTSHGHYGLKVDPYTLTPESPSYIDPLTGEVSQRPHTTHVSPPVVTSSMGSGNNKYRKQYKLSKNSPSSNYHNDGFMSSPYGSSSPFDHPHANGLGNQVSYATSSHIGPPWSPNAGIHWRKAEQSKLGIKTKRKSSKMPTSSIELDPLGKEKPIHRCGICNRGFLNKSNIKVHLRTHTGEKPFRCDTCSKAFRQKAHLLKHVQIHKRITRD